MARGDRVLVMLGNVVPLWEVMAGLDQAGRGGHPGDDAARPRTTAQIGNSPGQRLKPGSMGRPLPGYRVALLDPDGGEANEGEISLRLDPRPTGLMLGYKDNPAKTAQVTAGGFYRTGDVAMRDRDGYITYVALSFRELSLRSNRVANFLRGARLAAVLAHHPLGRPVVAKRMVVEPVESPVEGRELRPFKAAI